MKRAFARVSAVAVFGLVAAESFARFGLGLGTPPLSIEDPEIEYMFKPSQEVWRFGNRQLVNEYGMRSRPVPVQKPENEFRILTIGDSVLNGGNLTDHDELATSLLSGSQVRVLNASAGSWGPPNMLAYVEKFGLFDADLLVVVLSSHDAGDAPTFAPLNPNTHPTRQPLSALTEGISRYLPRYLPSLGERAGNGETDESLNMPKIDQQALDAVTALAKQSIPTCFVLHPSREEFKNGKWDARYTEILRAAGSAKIVDEMEFLQSSEDYRDGIHLSVEGQKKLAQAIYACR